MTSEPFDCRHPIPHDGPCEPRTAHQWILCWCGVNHAANGEDRCDAEVVIDTASCDHVAGHPGRHRFMGVEAEWTADGEPRTATEAATPPLDVERLAEAWFIGIQHRNGLDQKAALSRWSSPDEDMRHMRGMYLDVARIALARLTEQEERP